MEKNEIYTKANGKETEQMGSEKDKCKRKNSRKKIIYSWPFNLVKVLKILLNSIQYTPLEYKVYRYETMCINVKILLVNFDVRDGCRLFFLFHPFPFLFRHGGQFTDLSLLCFRFQYNEKY